MRKAEQIKQSETAQISLFATESWNRPALVSGRIVQLSGPQKMESPLVKDYMESRSLSRTQDPMTSKRAGEKTKEFRARHISKIWGALKDFGKMNYKDIAKLTNLEPVAVARRRKEMEENHLIRVLGEEKDGCQLWEAI